MVKPYNCKIAVSKKCTAISNISRTWEECWQALCNGDAIFTDGENINPNWPKTSPLSKLDERAGWQNPPEYLYRFKTIMQIVGNDMRGMVDELADNNKGIRIHGIIATCHSDAGPLTALVDYTAGITKTLPEDAWDMMEKFGFSSFLNESIGRKIPISIVSSACASALVATSYGADLINANICDAVLVVALDGMSRVATAGFQNIGAMAKNQCSPYDVNRSGTTVGEGGVGFLIARENCLKPDDVYGHIAGTSIFCDAAHIVEPNPEGVRSVLQEALNQAELAASEIAGIYWHGTGTRHNDKVEAEVSQVLFGETPPPSTSTKGNLGHTMGASGAFNILAACETNKSGKMVPVCSLKDLEYPNLDIVRDAPRQIAPGPMLVTALGFGGINAAVVVTP